MDLLDVPEHHPPRGALPVVYNHLPRVSRIFSPDTPYLFRLISAFASQEARIARVWDGCFMSVSIKHLCSACLQPLTCHVVFLAPSRFKSGCCVAFLKYCQSLQEALPVIHNQSHDSFNPACCCFCVPGWGGVTHLSHLMAVSDKPPAWLLSVSSPRYSRHYWKTSIVPF